MNRPYCVSTDFWLKPIPTNRFDASACIDGQQESGPFGHGATREEAVADLLEQLDEVNA